MNQVEGQYGAWSSPVTAQLVAESGIGSSALPREIQVDGRSVYWVAQQPEEDGRYAIFKLQPDGSVMIMTPPGFSTRSRVHEYGGGVYCVCEGTIFFTNNADQRIYRHEPGTLPVPITPAFPVDRAHRYADGVLSPDGKWMLWVRERHEMDGKIFNEIVLVPSDGSIAPRTLISDHDFFSNPRFSPDGNRISWLSWDQPQMPWDGTELWIADFDIADCEIGSQIRIAGNEGVSIFQPEWCEDGSLFFISDESGWWNIYRKIKGGDIENICPVDAEFGYPQWMFGFSKYTFLAPGSILATCKFAGQSRLVLIDVQQKELDILPTPYTTFENPSIRAANDHTAWFFAGSAEHPPALCRFDLSDRSASTVIDLAPVPISPEFVSVPEHIRYRNRRGSNSYAFFFAPKNSNHDEGASGFPPLIMMSHSGPTSAARPHLDLETQFWTSRGFAVVDVDYSGSVGYGRAYRERLNGNMGVIDVEDCLDAADYLIRTGRVDPEKLIIRGSSAGGYITLCALTSHDSFAAGAIYYGLADLEALASHTHKFEANYLDKLIGPYPEEKKLYVMRSPINRIDQIKCPLIIFQGLKDRVVPPEQSDRMAAALNANGLPYAYIKFLEEGHGFDRAETIEKALESEHYFYARILSIPWNADREPVKIHNFEPDQ
jgi:dipeptidyl aminopeptidase/acylaminoacyl peptidase